MTTPNLGLTELANGQANYLNANEAFAVIDALLQTPVISKTLTAAPSTPANGDLYIMATAWSGVDGAAAGSLALYRTGAGWMVITPKEGWKFEVAADEITYRYDGGDWLAFGGASMVNPMTTEGDLIVGGGSGSPERLAAGSDGQILKMVAGEPSWEDDPALGGLTLASKSSSYTLVLEDANTGLLHPSADTTARTWTIPANASVAFPVGTAISFVNQNGAGVVSIAITTDTMRLAGAGTTGTRTLAANGMATALKITATEWIISGVGLT